MKKTIAIIAAASLTGCMNMPTPPSQITGSYASGIEYSKYDANQLYHELDSLSRRENDLVVAQNQRIKTSQMQAFWWGFGTGDGIEAAELAHVKGEKEAVKRALQSKGCKVQ